MSLRRARRRGMVAGAMISKSRANKAAQTGSSNEQTAAEPASQAAAAVDTEQLKKLAELKDSGILTQEEFDAKKKQILGL